MLVFGFGFMNIHLEYLISDNTEFQLCGAAGPGHGLSASPSAKCIWCQPHISRISGKTWWRPGIELANFN